MNGQNSHRVLNWRALRILACISERRDRGQSPPSFRELAEITELRSPNAVHCHLERLRELGLLHWDFGKARTYVLTCRFVAVPA